MLKKKKNYGSRSTFSVEDQGAQFGAGRCVVCGAVCVCGECHGVSNDVLNDVFCAVSLRHVVKSHDHCSKKPPQTATQAFSLWTQA